MKFFYILLFLLLPNIAHSSLDAVQPLSDEEILSSQTISQIPKTTISKVNRKNFTKVAVLQILNKITAKTSEFEVNIDDTIEFGRLIITARKCWQAPLDQRPESKVLLEVDEIDAENRINRIFFGWMFASTPSISSLEHPIYDITALNCKNDKQN